MSYDKELTEGQGAERILGDEIFLKAVGGVREKFTAQMISGETLEKREAARGVLVGLGELHTALASIRDTGVIASRRIDEQAVKASRSRTAGAR